MPAWRTRCVTALLPVAASVVVGCEPGAARRGANEEKPPDAPPPAVERRIVPTRWDTIWAHGLDEADTTVLLPFRLATDGARVYVWDAGAHRLAALDAATGQLAWTLGRKGGGAHEFQSPSAIAVLPSGEVAVADPPNSRIALVGAEGHIRERVPVRGLAIIDAMCGLRDGTLLLGAAMSPTPLLRVDRTGAVLDRPQMPWRDLDADKPLARHMTFAPDPRAGGCVMALTFGRGFARFDGRRFGPPQRYVEWFDLPQLIATTRRRGKEEITTTSLSERRVAAIAATVLGNELAIAFEGTTRRGDRLIDLYDRVTGAYRRSYMAPMSVAGMVAADSTLVLQGGAQGALIALRPRQVPAQ